MFFMSQTLLFLCMLSSTLFKFSIALSKTSGEQSTKQMEKSGSLGIFQSNYFHSPMKRAWRGGGGECPPLRPWFCRNIKRKLKDERLYLFPTSAKSNSEVQSLIVAYGQRNNAFALEAHRQSAKVNVPGLNQQAISIWHLAITKARIKSINTSNVLELLQNISKCMKREHLRLWKSSRCRRTIA